MKPIIEARGISKIYERGVRYKTLRESFDAWFSRGEKKESGRFWALKDVDFEVARGEITGIIGKNGAGKSTLLKILSRITEPTSGRAVLRGRAASLLEVGTGFHPQLTGRENIFLNGAILGMRKAEIASKFDEIVSFSELEKFIDTPVKHYSSGMYVRLAFAVAAHLEPEILLIDEVLAVGDVLFQKKCLNKMGEIAEGGRTVLFVSHNMGAIENLTGKSLFLKDGCVAAYGPTPEVIRNYFGDCGLLDSFYDATTHERKYPELSRAVEFAAFRFKGSLGAIMREDEPLRFEITLRANEEVKNFRVSMTAFRSDGAPAASFFGPESCTVKKGEKAVFAFELKDHRLVQGVYSCGFSAGKGNEKNGRCEFDTVFNVMNFEIISASTADKTKPQWPLGWGSIRLPEPSVSRIQ